MSEQALNICWKGISMKKQKGHLIKSVDPGSIAEELELEPGDRLLTINGNEVEDIFDYEYYVDSESMVMLVEKADGEQWELEIENEYQDLGITFENGLMSDYKSCSNKCIFCRTRCRRACAKPFILRTMIPVFPSFRETM